MCNEVIVPDEFMNTINFCVRSDVAKGASLAQALDTTFCFGKCPVRDAAISRALFLGDTVCFTDDMYWKVDV